MTADYTHADYAADCADPSMPHAADYARFVAFYEQQGREREQLNQQVRPGRIEWIDVCGCVLELGCHCGFQCIYWAQRGRRCTGVDISSTLIAEAKRRAAREKRAVRERVQFHCCDILQYEDERRYGSVILTDVLEHVIDPGAVVAKAAEWLAPGGKMWISAPTVRIGTYAHLRGVTPEELDRWCTAAGLQCQLLPGYSDEGYPTTRAVAKLP